MLVAGAVFCRNYRAEEPVVEEVEEYIPLEDRYKTADYRISPYDSLIKSWSDSASLDWRFVSAIIFHESNFRHDALSRRGAAGLMQMMPSTAKAFGADSLLDASQSVMAGTRYLQSLSRNYGSVAANETERQKLTLAAYNAGEGNILKCIRTAEEKGVDPTRWDNVVSIIPEVPGFHGKQTIAYVREVLDTFDEYAEVYPR